LAAIELTSQFVSALQQVAAAAVVVGLAASSMCSYAASQSLRVYREYDFRTTT